MRKAARTIITIFLLFTVVSRAFTQGTCPPNIGFEQGNFTGWTCHAGSISVTSGVNVSPSGVIPGRHTLLQNTIPQEKDLYGNFPVNCPNGSGYSIRLGNSSVGAQAERVSYTFTVPADKNEYSIIYNYAIVFQNPNHLPEEQPKFTSSVYDNTAGQYLGCGAFEFIASSGLPDFQISDKDVTVWYKPWSPVTVKLMGCAGKTITLEFTVNDCSRGGHFGYAYLDVNENCKSPITGNVYCNGASSLTLTAPFGFKEYHWYKGDFSAFLGTGNTLKLQPVPAIGTRYAVEIVPYPGLGCLDTLYTTIEASSDAFSFVLPDTLNGCVGLPVNLTLPAVTQGSTPGLQYSYFLDSVGLQYLATPTYVTQAGRYYIKAENAAGCSETQAIELRMNGINLNLNAPPHHCFPATVDLTDPAVTSGSDADLSYSYWANAAATIPLTNASSIDTPGIYYIKASNSICSKVSGVQVNIWMPDDLKTSTAIGCGGADLTSPVVTAGSAPIFNYSYWRDSAATIPVPNPKYTAPSGRYFIRAGVPSGCAIIKGVDVVAKPLPEFAVTDPAAVTAPAKVDITTVFIPLPSVQYSYWLDAAATRPVPNPSGISKTGKYFIRALDSAGCEYVNDVNVVIEVPFHPVILYPNAFSPNGDGINDRFRLEIAGDIDFRGFKIFNRWGELVFESKTEDVIWDGQKNGSPLPVGTYYWVVELVNNKDGRFHRRTGSITLLR
ncbi:MAG TPA: gliding motility-associated C-terminal domain-containing protein [Chitinophagaceae bacterium]